MSGRDCGLSMLAGPADHSFLRMMYRHAFQTARFPFAESLLVIDTMPSPRFPKGSPDTAALERVAQEMLAAGEITKIVRTSARRKDLERRHFGRPLHRQRDFRGVPMLGWILGIENMKTEFACHFDSDILTHAAPGYSWVKAAMQRIATDDRVMFVSPNVGPQPASSDGVDQMFCSQRFVVNRERLCGLLPLHEVHSSWKRQLLMRLGGPSSYWPWETQVRHAMRRSDFLNVWLCDPRAWGLHSPSHNDQWRLHLPLIVHACENGLCPPSQRGKFELDITDWVSWFTAFDRARLEKETRLAAASN